MNEQQDLLKILLEYAEHFLKPVKWNYQSLTPDEKIIIKDQETVDQIKALCGLKEVFSDTSAFSSFLKEARQTTGNEPN